MNEAVKTEETVKEPSRLKKQLAVKSAKKKKQASQPRSTVSFAQMMSQAQLKALQPYIQNQVALAVHTAVQQQMQKMAQVVMEHLSQVQTRQLAVERLLNVDSDKLAESIAEVTDEGLGYEKREGPAEVGDLVRISVLSKTDEKDAEFGETEKIQINTLGKENKEGEVQTLKEVEDILVGMSVGETESLSLPPEQEGLLGSIMEVTVCRVSYKKPVEVTKKGDVNAEG